MANKATVPDLKGVLSYTLLASAFILLGILNPFAGEDYKTHSHTWMAVALIIAVTFSWSFTIRRWKRWRSLPDSVRKLQLKALVLDPYRAKSHALMSALALTLTAFAFLGRAALPEIKSGFTNTFLFCAASVIAVLSTMVLSKSIRDMTKQKKN